jgi:hypothetical protein
VKDRKHRTGKTGPAENRTHRTEQAEQGSPNRTVRTGLKLLAKIFSFPNYFVKVLGKNFLKTKMFTKKSLSLSQIFQSENLAIFWKKRHGHGHRHELGYGQGQGQGQGHGNGHN